MTASSFWKSGLCDTLEPHILVVRMHILLETMMRRSTALTSSVSLAPHSWKSAALQFRNLHNRHLPRVYLDIPPLDVLQQSPQNLARGRLWHHVHKDDVPS